MKNQFIVNECKKHGIPESNIETRLHPQYSQYAEDLVLLSLLRSRMSRQDRELSSVRYLEIGANHPIQTSNTYLLSTFGASGVLVEADPDLIGNIKLVRPADVVLPIAVVPSGYPRTINFNVSINKELSSVSEDHIRLFGELGRIDRTIRVKTDTLDNILSKYFNSGCDLLTVDVEGLDLDILRTSTLPIRPTFIMVEPSRRFNKTADRDFDDAMAVLGYEEIARTAINTIFTIARGKSRQKNVGRFLG